MRLGHALREYTLSHDGTSQEKVSWANSCGTWLVGQSGKAAPDVWLICMLSHEEILLKVFSKEICQDFEHKKSCLCEMMKKSVYKFLIIISAILSLRSSLNIKDVLWLIKHKIISE